MNSSFIEDRPFYFNGTNTTFRILGVALNESVLEIRIAGLPSGTTFQINGTNLNITAMTVNGFLRIPATQLPFLSVKGPTNFSGRFTLIVQASVVNATGHSIDSTPLEPVGLTVMPDADSIRTYTPYQVPEDAGVVAFGAVLANPSSPSRAGISLNDVGTGTGNNPETETISQLDLTIPLDTPARTWNMSGLYVPVSGTISGFGSAQVTFDPIARKYTITSTLIPNASSVSTVPVASRQQAESDIRATLATFAAQVGPEDNANEGNPLLSVTTVDVNVGTSSTRVTTIIPFQVRSVADTPAVQVVTPASNTTEDGPNIPLNISVGRSKDNDGSESLSVRITIPSLSGKPMGDLVGTPSNPNVTVISSPGGIYTITALGATPAVQEAALNSFLSTGQLQLDPRDNVAGNFTLKIDVISTETNAADVAPSIYGGADNTSATETVTDYITFIVFGVADTPATAGNAIGREDTTIPVPIRPPLVDLDGSESYSMTIIDNLPVGTKLYGSGGLQLTASGGFYNLTPADVTALKLLPPLHFSSALSGQIVLNTVTTVIEAAIGGGSTSLAVDIPVHVTGVADKPGSRNIVVNAIEDQPYRIGAVVNITGILVDTDGSEKLSFVFKNIPPGKIPSSTTGTIENMGGGSYRVSVDALPNLVLPAIDHFSGENPDLYKNVKLQAVSQELDGDQALSDLWNVAFNVLPIADGFTAITKAGIQVKEGDLEANKSISLRDFSFIYGDADTIAGATSEKIISYTFNLTNLIDNAQIGARLQALTGVPPTLTNLIPYIGGTFSFNNTEGTITVDPSRLSTLSLNGTLFFDSNVDFSIPVKILIRDYAVIGGTNYTDDIVASTSYKVDLVGTADTPTVFTQNVSGAVNVGIPISLGGNRTDTDIALNRNDSELVYYIVTALDKSIEYTFINGAGNLLGLDLGSGKYYLATTDLPSLHIKIAANANLTNSSVLQFQLTTVAVENDGDRATNTAPFTVATNDVGGGGTIGFNATTSLTFGTSTGREDTPFVANLTVTTSPSNATGSIVFSNIPSGTVLSGVLFDPTTGKFFASATTVNAGGVRITPTKDFSGNLTMTVQGVATGPSGEKFFGEEINATFFVEPVADGPSIVIAPTTGNEDESISLNISLAETDVDDSEVVGNVTYIRVVTAGASIAGLTQVLATDPDAGK
jgi:hypothetical protein